ncbi:guanine nucleotide binding protein, alpha subunit [Rhodocollybia butyracea]|uniref:Guanine nucleotide binding protein, alpha subunit n=1 Tax=Rhodocollybia butyracea TaxID=206335 RepID=A0A9P5PVP7_9AGAR|nr:guanine nucleotide binding protein, alpha subunit [Rhodocollybia butyracea]
MPTATGESVWPPPSSPSEESQEDREARLEQEKEAKRVSDAIDLDLNAEKEAKKKNVHGAKILLLGQAESGKSTILKNFQLHFSPNAFHAEAEIWRPVIHLNLVRSVNFIINMLAPRSASGTTSPTLTYPLNDSIRRLFFSLAPLKSVETSLTKRISGSLSPVILDNSSTSADSPYAHYHPAKASEISVRSGVGWKGLLKFRRQSGSSSETHSPEDIQNRRIISACADDIIALWRSPGVQEKLRQEDVFLKDQPGFFLEDIERISKVDYLPTPDDVLRARVSTIGPEEHHIPMENSLENGGNDWIIYDVGGDRSQRAAWAQFFDDGKFNYVSLLIAFNQALAEDETVNRLADSMKLWRMICSNKLLASVDLILLLNKIDILDAQLKAGVQFSKYVTSYRDKPNETEAVAKYLLDMFTSLHKQHSTKKRKMHPHLTCAVDTKATAAVITHIQELILIKTLAQTNII